MPHATLTPQRQLNDRELLRHVNALRKLDNLHNWLYIAREYLFLATVIGLAVAFHSYRQVWELGWAWNIPVTLLAIVLIGAGQHRLTNIGHEASHYMLFRNRLLNELASDWFAMFAVWSTTHHYRLQHLAHHQFPNDPERDPDVMQMTVSGHRYRFPMPKLRFLWECILKPVLWLPSLVRYVRSRARFAAMGSKTGPYAVKRPVSRLLIPVGLGYLASLAGSLTACVIWEKPLLLVLIPVVMLTAILLFYALIPGRMYSDATIKPDVPMRWLTMMRMAYFTLLFTALAWLSYWTGKPWGLYYIVLWLTPLGTTFGFFMLLRQIVQHGNADQGRFSNTRIFHVGRLIRFAVFPWGMDYHLPHHLFPMVPHYRLRQLHALLSETDEYRQKASLVDGYFLPRERPPQHPTVLDVMASPALKN
jgi:fatty acid desaturase